MPRRKPKKKYEEVCNELKKLKASLDKDKKTEEIKELREDNAKLVKDFNKLTNEFNEQTEQVEALEIEVDNDKNVLKLHDLGLELSKLKSSNKSLDLENDRLINESSHKKDTLNRRAKEIAAVAIQEYTSEMNENLLVILKDTTAKLGKQASDVTIQNNR